MLRVVYKAQKWQFQCRQVWQQKAGDQNTDLQAFLEGATQSMDTQDKKVLHI